VAQHDYSIANGSGAAVRSDLNNALSAIVSQNSGTTEPTTTYAYMRWADTTAGVMKMRNGANNAWITLYQLDGEWSTIAFENGSASAPSIYFKDSGTDTGIYSPGTDQVAISTGGTGRLFVDSSGRVGLGTSSPGQDLEIYRGASTSSYAVFRGNANSATNALLIGQDSSGLSRIFQDGNQPITFWTGSAASERMRLDSSGRLGIGTTTPGYALEVASTVDYQGYFVNNTSGTGVLIGGISGAGTITSQSTATPLVFARGGTEAARIDASSRLLVGTSTARSNFYNGSVSAVSQIEGVGSASRAALALINNASANDEPLIILAKTNGTSTGSNTVPTSGQALGSISFQGSDGTEFVNGATISAEVDGTPGANDLPSRLVFSTTADGASSPTERLRIDKNGSVQIGASGRPGSLTVTGDVNNNEMVYFDNLRTVGGYAEIDFRTAGTERGNIRWETGNVAYNTSSDYRLKENIKPMVDGINLVKQLRPCLFNFIEAGPENTMGGFIAHEVQEVVSYVVSGQKDAVREDGSIKPQCIDQSRLVPLLTAALQEAIAEIASLKDRVAALEAV
jgi:hypothetical protein